VFGKGKQLSASIFSQYLGTNAVFAYFPPPGAISAGQPVHALLPGAVAAKRTSVASDGERRGKRGQAGVREEAAAWV